MTFHSSYCQTQRISLAITSLQIGVLTIAVFSLATSPLVWLAIPLVAGLMYLFSSMTIVVTEDAVRWHFGPGFLARSVLVSEITGLKIVRNKWWYGSGIYYTPTGWLYNLSGQETVQLQLTNGKKIRLGTSEPEGLYQAIDAARDAA